MPLHKILKQERAQALSNPVVIGLAAILVTAGIVLAWATMIALVSSGNYLLSLLASVPLGAGLGHYALATVRYCRPQWFKPEEPTEHAEQPKADSTTAAGTTDFERGRQAELDRLAKELFERGGFATLQLNPDPLALPRMRFVEPHETQPVDSVRLHDGVFLVRKQG